MTSVENAYIVPRFVPGACALQVGNWADLRFTVTNDRANENETLLAVSTDAARMTRMTPPGGVAINPGARAAFGQPVTEEADSAAQAPAVALAGLDSDARPGTSVEVKFDFKRAGAIELRVPIEACPTG